MLFYSNSYSNDGDASFAFKSKFENVGRGKNAKIINS